MKIQRYGFLIAALAIIVGNAPVIAGQVAHTEEKVHFSTKVKRFVATTVQTIGDGGKVLAGVMVVTLICWLKFRDIPVKQPVQINTDVPPRDAVPGNDQGREGAPAAAQPKAPVAELPQSPKRDNPAVQNPAVNSAEGDSKYGKAAAAASQVAQSMAQAKPAEANLNNERDNKYGKAEAAPERNSEQVSAAKPVQQEQPSERELKKDQSSKLVHIQELENLEADLFEAGFAQATIAPESQSWIDQASSAWTSFWKSKPTKPAAKPKPVFQAPCMLPPK